MTEIFEMIYFVIIKIAFYKQLIFNNKLCQFLFYHVILIIFNLKLKILL
ncbi:MAG: hypothetical protein JWR50_3080 [Mucilaginibacter sp.]|nr:hypothetical protein [Mucilaginibacter sp.]